MAFAEALKRVRVERGLTQRELAQKLNVNFMSIYRWENGKCFPKTKIAQDMIERVTKLDISDECKDDFIESLDVVRRKGISAHIFSFPDIDQELLCQIVDDSADAVYVIDLDTYKLLYVNRTTQNLMISKDTNSNGKRCYEYMMDKDYPCEDCPIKNIKGYEFSEQIIKHFTDERFLRIRGRKMKWNGKDIFISYVSNISDLVNTKNMVQDFLELVPMGAGVYQVYSDGRCELLYMNDGFYKMLGIDMDESGIKPGFTNFGRVHPDDKNKVTKIIADAIQSNDFVSAQIRIQVDENTYKKIVMQGKAKDRDKDKSVFYCAFMNVEYSSIVKEQ